MLVLTRKQDESIIIGQNIEVKILGIEEGKVKLGIEAPKNVEIYRKEVYVTIEAENKAATSVDIKNIEQLKKIFYKKD